MKKSLGIAITALLFSVPLFSTDSINERIKALEIELQSAMKSTYLPNDEQIARIKKEIDLLKMQQELESIKQKQSGATQSAKPQNPQSYESQNLQIQDSRNANQITQIHSPKNTECQIMALHQAEVAHLLALKWDMAKQS